MKYAIRVEETIGRTIIVEAENLIEAIEMVEDAANNDKILLDGIEDFVGREVKPSDVFEGGIVPDGRDVSFYEHLKPHIIETIFTSVWDGGYEITTNCKVNMETREVFDIEVNDNLDDIEGLDGLDREYITVDGEEFDVLNADEYEIGDGDFWY